MNNKLDPNPGASKREVEVDNAGIGGDRITIYGNVGPGANVGRGWAQSDQIAGRDLIVNGFIASSTDNFADLIADLREMIIQAKEAGELSEQAAKEALNNLDAAIDMVKKEKKPPKGPLIKKLESVADLLDAAVDVFNSQGEVAKTLLKALPIAALLVKLAIRFF